MLLENIIIYVGKDKAPVKLNIIITSNFSDNSMLVNAPFYYILGWNCHILTSMCP